MKIHLFLPALAAILGFALVSAPVIHAQTPAATTTTTPAPAAKPTSYKGMITAIDPAGKSITVSSTSKKTMGQSMTLLVTTATTFKTSAPALSDFAVGDAVTGSYTVDVTGAMDAHSIHKATHKSAKVKATTTEPGTPATTAAPAAQ